MDFFGRQAAARRATRWLVVLFVLAVIAVVIAVNAVVLTAAAIFTMDAPAAGLPDGNWLVTERPGRLRIITADGEVGEPITGLPDVGARGQGGLLDVITGP